MVTDELKDYIRQSLVSGITREEIQQKLLEVGWSEADITKAFQEIDVLSRQPLKPASRIILYSIFISLIIVLSGITLYLWRERLDLSNTNAQKVRDFYARLSQSQISFTDSGEMIFPDEQKLLDKKAEYVKAKEDFVEIDLRAMQLTLYKNGTSLTTMKVLTKGKQGSWWETPTGDYRVLGKSVDAFSSIGNVWMPYSIQFYGNYFIHGWPYYENGEPVPQGYSGGCIRLSTDDARAVFNFVTTGTPVLVKEEYIPQNFGMLTPKLASSSDIIPAVNAKSFLVVDLTSGETLLEKKAEEKLPIASLTKLMTAVVAHEVIYLGRAIKVTPQMLASIAQIFYPQIGERYIGLDLLYPLLTQSSNDVANILSGFIGNNTFIQDMNNKASSLEMADTHFNDASGISDQNVSTVSDFSKLLRYIYFKRPFIFEITKGVAFENVGLIKIGDTIDISNLRNINEFIGDPDLIGVKNGQTNAARQTIATVWNIHTKQGDAPVAIIVFGSENRYNDTEILLNWLKNNFST